MLMLMSKCETALNLKQKQVFALQIFFPVLVWFWQQSRFFSSSITAMLTLWPHYVVFQAPEILCCGTGPPSSRLLLQFHFCVFFFFRPTDPKSENVSDNKRRKKSDGLSSEKKSFLATTNIEKEYWNETDDEIVPVFVQIFWTLKFIFSCFHMRECFQCYLSFTKKWL